jgi:glycosyltransferase involved in cell wall biosynthesis
MMLMSRSAYRAIGGFSEQRNLGALGVPDMAMRLRRKGIHVLTQGVAEATTMGERLGANTVPDAVRRAFAEHYAKELGALERDRKAPRRRALVIDSIWPDPWRDAASEVIVSHARLIEQLGYAVEFSAFEALDSGEGCDRPALSAGLAAYGPTHFQSPLEHIEARRNDLGLVYVHRVAAAERVIPLLRRIAPQARILFNIADLHFLRRFRESELSGASNMLVEIDALRQRELNAMAAADVVITHSQEEAVVIRHLLPDVAVQVVGWPFAPRPGPPPFAARKGIAFVGGYRHKPNGDAVQFFVAEILPKLRERLPDVELSLIGSHMPESITSLAGPGVRILGFQRDLGKALDAVRLSIAPLRFGAGVKGKVLTSLAAGVPCVMSPIAAEGLELPQELAGTIAETTEAWVDAIAALYENEAAWRLCAEAGRRFIVAQFSAENVRTQLQAALEATNGPAPAEAEPVDNAETSASAASPEVTGTDHPVEPDPEPTA